MESHTLSSGIQTSRLLWEPTPVAVSADEAMAPAEDSDRSLTEEAQELLRDMLLAGPVLGRDAKAGAKDAGITEKALRRARDRLNLQTRREGFGAAIKSYWALPTADSRPHSCPDPVVFVKLCKSGHGLRL